MKRFIGPLALILVMTGCVSAAPVASSSAQKVTVITTSPARRIHPKRSKVVVKKTVVVGTRVKRLPGRGVTIYYNNLPYIYVDGVYYKKLASSKYEVVRPEKGMIVPQLPDYNVEEVCINGETLFLFDKTLYKQIPTPNGLQYKVTGFID